MPRSALEELQHLKALLAATDAPDSRRTSASSQVSPDIIAAQLCKLMKEKLASKALPLQSTVAALEKALGAGDEGIEDAIRDSGAIKDYSAAQRENEILDLRRIITARERSLDSLRSTLDTTKQFYEDRMAEAADHHSAKDAELETARMELAQSKEEHDMLVEQMTRLKEDVVEEIASLQRSYEEDAREAREAYSKEAEELQGALQAQEQEVKQLLSEVSLANKCCHEAESRAEVLQTDVTALQGLQAETEKGNISCKQQLQKHKNRNSELEDALEETQDELKQAKQLQAETRSQLQSKQAVVKRLRSFLKAELRASAEVEAILIAAQKMFGCKHHRKAIPDASFSQLTEGGETKQLALPPAKALPDSAKSKPASGSSTEETGDPKLEDSSTNFKGQSNEKQCREPTKDQKEIRQSAAKDKQMQRLSSHTDPRLQYLDSDIGKSNPKHLESNSCSSSEDQEQALSPQERPRKRKQVSSHWQSWQKGSDAAKVNRLDKELGKLRLLLDE